MVVGLVINGFYGSKSNNSLDQISNTVQTSEEVNKSDPNLSSDTLTRYDQDDLREMPCQFHCL